MSLELKGIVSWLSNWFTKTEDLSAVALSNDYDDLDNLPTIPEGASVDNALSSSSTNPVQNKVINSALLGKAPTSHANSSATYGAGSTSNYGHVKTINSLTQSSYSDGTALSAYQGYLLNKNKVDEDDLLDLIYPIGAIYIDANSANDTCPIAKLLGGTWERIQDRFLLASTDQQGVGSTGGEATHTLTVSEMPSHTHTQNSHSHGTGNSSYTKFLISNADIAVNGTKRSFPSSGSSAYFVYSTNSSAGIQEITATAGVTATNQNTGGGGAHNNMPPYLVVNVWKRTA